MFGLGRSSHPAGSLGMLLLSDSLVGSLVQAEAVFILSSAFERAGLLRQ